MGNSKEFVRIEDVIFLNIKKAGTLHELALCQQKREQSP